MQQVGHFLPSSEFSRQSRVEGQSEGSRMSQPTGEAMSSRLSDALLETLWSKMTEIFGHRWTSSFGSEPSKVWASGLAGVTGLQLADGLRKIVQRGMDWPPSLPEFRSLCEGIQTFDEVRAEFAPGFSGERSQFGRLVYLKLDTWSWRHAPADRADRMLRDAYGEAVRWIRDGKPLPPSPVADLGHEQPKRKAGSPEVAEAALRDIAAILGA